MAIKSYKDLSVWQAAVELCTDIYRATNDLPKSEIFGLTSQIRRASTAIPANIAEGNARGTKEYIHFLRIAYGSGAELETHLLVARNIGYLSEDDYNKLNLKVISVQKMLNKLISVLTI